MDYSAMPLARLVHNATVARHPQLRCGEGLFVPSTALLRCSAAAADGAGAGAGAGAGDGPGDGAVARRPGVRLDVPRAAAASAKYYARERAQHKLCRMPAVC